MPHAPPHRVHGRYRVLSLLGEGGVATALRVWDEAIERERALKLVSSQSVQLLRNEFALLAEVFHPHIVRVFDFGVLASAEAADAGGFYTAELVEGTTLDTFAERHVWADVVRALVEALSGLAFLHGVQLCHGDFKPANVVVTAKGRSTVVDLSCACRFGTRRASLFGTPGYIAPELAGGAPATARADLFAVGKTIAELAHCCRDAPDLDRLIDQLCDPDPHKRPAEVHDVISALGIHRHAEPVLTLMRSPRLLERDEEVGLFEESLARMTRGEEHACLLHYQAGPGEGKSRLLQELKWRAELTCDVADLVRPPDTGPRDGDILRLFARLGAALPAAASQLSVDSAAETARLLSASRRPTVVFIDDVDRLTTHDAIWLKAVIRFATPAGKLLVVTSGTSHVDLESPIARARPLRTLSPAAVRAWVDERIPDRQIERAWQITGGHPGHLERVLSQAIRTGHAPGAEPSDIGSNHAAWLESTLARLSRANRHALALVVASPFVLESSIARTCLNDLLDVAQQGWIATDGQVFWLARAVERDALRHALGEDMTSAYRTVASSSGNAITRLVGWLHLGRVESAQREVDALASGEESRDALLRVTDQLMWLARRAGTPPEVLSTLIRLQLEASRPDRALSTAAMLYRQDVESRTSSRVLRLIGKAYLQLESPKKAARYLLRAMSVSPAPKRAETAGLLARAYNQLGRYGDAASLVLATMGGHFNESSLVQLGRDGVELSRCLGIAVTYTGDPDLAERAFRYGLTHTHPDEDPTTACRDHSYLAIGAFRQGRVRTAVEEYRRALELAERHDLSIMLPTLNLNVGTALQQLGDWGQALTLYERGARAAAALGKSLATATIELNRANLNAEIGLVDRARAALKRADDAIEAGRIDHLRGHRHMIDSDICRAEADPAGALAALRVAADEHHRRASTREYVECRIAIGRNALLLEPPDVEEASRCWEQASQTLDQHQFRDLDVRLFMLEILLGSHRGGVFPERSFTRIRALADELGVPALSTELLSVAGLAKRKAGDEVAARRLLADARAGWSTIADTMPPALIDTFWAHPARASLAVATEADSTPEGGDSRTLRRLLVLTAQISSTLALDRVLELSMDAAIELARAERGFLLLSPDRASRHAGRAIEEGSHQLAMRIAAARNVDRTQLADGELALSTSIADQVISTGQPVVTVDASGDPRFRDNKSVHAMKLMSVLCVPVAARGVVLGALYLDNRFERATFAASDVGIVVAFATHIATAIENAELHQSLELERRRLRAEKREVERLSRGQAHEIEALKERVRVQQETLSHRYDYKSIVHRSPQMADVLSVLDRVIDSTLTVLVEGESGTGKELIARAIHVHSPRSDGPFISINCGALSESLLESELFGHEKGAFTGADRARQGLMVAAKGGTLFLDEVGEMTPSIQVKLLRALQEREVRPLGSSKVVALDVRVVCATNRTLKTEVEQGRFREDLYYRLSVVALRLPPLRERPEDIVPIARRLLDTMAERDGTPPISLTRRAARALMAYPFPGNVRQLENVLARAYVLSNKAEITEADLDLSTAPTKKKRAKVTSRREFEMSEAALIQQTLLENRWNVSLTARTLGIPRNTLYRKMAKLGIDRRA